MIHRLFTVKLELCWFLNFVLPCPTLSLSVSVQAITNSACLTAPIIEPYIFVPLSKEKKGHLSALCSWEHFCRQNRCCWGWVYNCSDTAVGVEAQQKIKGGLDKLALWKNLEQWERTEDSTDADFKRLTVNSSIVFSISISFALIHPCLTIQISI